MDWIRIDKANMQTKTTTYRLQTSFPSSLMMIAQIRNSLFCLFLFLIVNAAGASDDQPRLLRESQFQSAINRALIANGERAILQDYLQRLAQEREVAILLDRRVDPSQRVNIAISENTFDAGIRSLVKQIGLEVSVVGDSLIIGPPESTNLLRTRCAIARREFDEIEGFTPKRQFEVLRRYELKWDDLSTPREVLEQVASRYKLKIENLEDVPHDLWFHGTLTYPNLVESLTILLTQFQLSFEWIDAETIRIVPETPRVGIEGEHRPRGMPVADALSLVRRNFPNLEVQRSGSRIAFSGLLEEHEAVAVLVGEKQPRRPMSGDPESRPLNQRTFTLKMVRKPFGSLMATLQQQGIEVHYNAQEFSNAGIDLGQKISIELEQATIDQLLKESCDKVGLDYEVEDFRILLKLKAELE